MKSAHLKYLNRKDGILIMILFKKNKASIVDNLLNVKNNEELFHSFTELQNEITVDFSTKVIAITSISKDNMSAAFAKAFAQAYAMNKSNALIIDANLYNPCLSKLLSHNTNDVESRNGEELKAITVDRGVDAICLDQNVYPPEVYKAQVIQNIIKENENKYDHFIVLVPAINEHKEIVLLNDVLNAVVLISQRNITKRKDIFEAISYCAENKLPLAKTVVIK